MADPSARQAQAVGELLRDAAMADRSDAATLEELATLMLGAPPAEVPWRSTLNADGSALQVCVSLRGQSSSVRLVADPGANATPDRRVAESLEAIDALAERVAPHIRDLLPQLVDRAVPRPADDAYLSAGVAWTGASVSRPGIALYFNAMRPTPDLRWKAAEAWIGGVRAPDVQHTLRSLRTGSAPVSLALEGSSPEQCVTKVYVRLLASRSLTELGVPAFAVDSLQTFLGAVAGDRLRRSGLTLSIGFDTERRIEDAKLDLCAHCLDEGDPNWPVALEDAMAGQIPRTLLRRFLRRRRTSEVALVGLGVDRRSARLNVYLKPRIH